jgi:CRISPR/Cas system-associated exonuclease Cas4 (RecB family)
VIECPVDIEGIYAEYISDQNELNRLNRYEGNEQYYHASGAGSCSRKLYYETIEQVEPSDAINLNSQRIMRLGTIVHNDFEKAFTVSSTNSNTNSNTEKNTTLTKEKNRNISIAKEKYQFYSELEIFIERLNVRGYLDLVAVCQEDDKVYLIDFKTIGSFPWSKRFGRKYLDPNPSTHQELQLGTYGLWVKQEYGRLDGMWLYFYNKDTSKMREVSVPLGTTRTAEIFWDNVNHEHKNGLPMFREGISPVENWNCRYCKYYTHCNPPFKVK